MNKYDAENLELAGAKLPQRSRTKITEFIDASAAAQSVVESASTALSEARDSFNAARLRLRERWQPSESTADNGAPEFILTDRRGEPVIEDAAFEREKSAVMRLYEALRRRKATYDKAAEARREHYFLSDLPFWLRDNPGPFTAIRVPDAKLGKGGNHADAVNELRARIDEIEARYAATESAPAPVEDLIGRAHAEIDELAERGSVSIYSNNRFGSPTDLRGSIRENGMVGVLPETIVWLLTDEIKTSMAAKIKAQHPGGGVSDFDRAAELSALEADKLALSRLEEAHICAAAEIGQTIARRQDADPIALLELETA